MTRMDLQVLTPTRTTPPAPCSEAADHCGPTSGAISVDPRWLS
ncbi:MAG TPA: hypothetical protein VGD29_07520 [Actinoplanes sp.]